MKQSFKTLMAAAIGACCISQANAIPIVNGSFEDPALNPGAWGLFGSIPGWTSSGNPIEIGRGTVYGVTGYDGLNVLELDSNGNAIVSQIVATAGGSYTLSFLYGQRVGTSPATNSFEVYWNSSLVGSFSPSSTVMSPYSTTVTALASNTLEFRGTGNVDSLGGIIDNVQLNGPQPNNLPDGGTTAVLLGCALSGLAYFRRKQG